MASSVITTLIMFIAVLGIASGLIVAIKNYADETEAVFADKGNKYNQYLQTDINIDTLYFDNTTNTTYIYVRNVGRTIMKIDEVDIYIDGVRFARNSSRTIEVEPDTDEINIGKWDPDEIILITAVRDLDSSVSHEAIVVTPYSVRDTKIFSV